MSMTIQSNTGYTPTIDPGTSQTGNVQGGTVQTGNGVGGGVSGTGGTPVPTGTGQNTNVGLPRSGGGSEPPQDLDGSKRSLTNALKDNLKEASAVLDKLISALRDPSKLAALLIEMNEMQRQNALDQRLASRDAAKSQLEGQAAETREAAVKELAAAAVGMAMSVVSFAVSAIGAGKMGAEAKTAGKAGKTAEEFKEAVADLKSKLPSVTDPAKRSQMEGVISKLEAQAGKFDNIASSGFREVDRLNMLTQAVNSLVKGMSEGIEGILRATAKMDEATGQMMAANAEDLRADGDAIKTFTDGIDELLRAALEFISKLADAEVELMASASRL